jgi:hypothetical protein
VGYERFAHSFTKTCRYVPSWGPPSRALPHLFAFPSWVLARPANLAVAATLAMLARAASCLFTPRKWEVWQGDTQNEYLASA